MAAAMNGVALHAGLIPCGAAKLAQSDFLRPSLRLAAQMRLRTIHVLTDDGICVGADGPAHQPVEQLAGLRAMPNVAVMRPADRIEAAECWDLALRRADGPSLIVLSARPLPALPRAADTGGCARGGYVVAEAEGPRRATLIATGAELHVAVEARALLVEQGIAAALVSLPCWRLFEAQDEIYRARVLGSAPRFGIEAACGFGWDRWLGPEGVFIGMTGYGASAPAYDLYRYFGITAEAVSAAVVKRLGS
jgi:transketolase